MPKKCAKKAEQVVHADFAMPEETYTKAKTEHLRCTGPGKCRGNSAQESRGLCFSYGPDCMWYGRTAGKKGGRRRRRTRRRRRKSRKKRKSRRPPP